MVSIGGGTILAIIMLAVVARRPQLLRRTRSMTARRVGHVPALLLVPLFVPSVARANLVVASDFTVTNGWTFNRCETFNFADQSASVATCVNGIAYYGQSTTTGLSGVTHDLWSTLFGMPPANSDARSWMAGLGIDGINADGHGIEVIAGWLGVDFDRQLTGGMFYSPSLCATSRIVETFAVFIGADGSCCGMRWGADRWGGVSYAVATTSEPNTFILVARGLLALVGRSASRRRW